MYNPKIITSCIKIRGLINATDIYNADGLCKVITVVEKWAMGNACDAGSSADLFEAGGYARRIVGIISEHLTSALSEGRPNIEGADAYDLVSACTTSAMLHFIEMSHMTAMAVSAIVDLAIDEESSALSVPATD